MPKIIDHVRERAIAEAKRIMLAEGYQSLTIRRVAAALDVAVGTIYNYFPSKDFLIASVMLEDWTEILQRLQNEKPAEEGIERIHRVFDGIKEFSDRYQQVWAQYSGQSFRSEANVHHVELVLQIQQLLKGVVGEEARTEDPFRERFLAENVLRFASDGHTEFSLVEGSFRKLIL